MKLINSSKLIINKSKYFGYLFVIESLKDIEKIIEDVRAREKKFCHICYGVCFEKEEIFKNDGEVGSPGKILLSILKNKNFNSHCLVVGRIYGGVNLGPAGVGKAFKKTGNACF